MFLLTALPQSLTAGLYAGWYESLFFVLIWFTVIELLAWGSLPLLAFAFRSAPDRGLGLSKAFGLLLTGYISWLLTALGLYRFNASTVSLTGLLLLACGYALIEYHFGGWRQFYSSVKEHILPVELLFASGLLLFTLFRSCTPEIFWGEKPMDFTFLNYFIRLEELPAQDPWAAGLQMN